MVFGGEGLGFKVGQVEGCLEFGKGALAEGEFVGEFFHLVIE